MRKAFATGQLRLANKIGKLMLHVYHGAKSVTLSAHSFPFRVVVGELGNSFQCDCPDKSKPTLDLQYLSVNSHSEMLSCIVLSDKKTLQKKHLKALAISLRCDGSVDRTQLDKIYLIAKLVSPTGVAENVFLGAAEPQTNGRKSVHDAILTACARTVRLGSDDDLSMQEAKILFCRASSLVTDGASVNVGQRNGLWALLEKDRENTKLN